MGVYGYARVSTVEQCVDRQIKEFKMKGINSTNIFIDKQSGKNFNRKNYIKLKEQLKEGDLLYIKSIDRLGRNYSEIRSEWENLVKSLKIDIKVIDMPLLDTTNYKDLMGTFISDLVLQILSFIAEQELIYIKQRQSEGIKLAKARGVKFGRPENDLPPNYDKVMKQWANKKISAKTAISLLNMPKSTFYYKIKQIKP